MGVNAAPGLSGGKVEAVDNLVDAVDNLDVVGLDSGSLPGGLPGCFRFSVNDVIEFTLRVALFNFLDCVCVIGFGRLVVISNI